jgi:hypothetical protein
MARAAPIALLLLVLAAGCGSSAKNNAGGPAVPWTSKKPAQVAERTPVATSCSAAELRMGQVRFVARLNGGIALVAVRNAGKRTCRLTGRPRVRFVKDGGPTQVQRPIPVSPTVFPEATYPASSLLALRPGESADVTVTWDNWCDPAVKGKPHLPPSAFRLTLPGGRGSLDADYNAVPQCLDPKAPTTIGVSVFQPSLIPTGHRWTEAFVDASVGGDPIHARRGTIAHFRVVLTNRSSTAVRFGRCPSYVQQLVPKGELEVYSLNCRAAHPIAPGKSLAFAMQVRVPSDAPIGANGLFWELDPFGARAPELHTRVTVDG